MKTFLYFLMYSILAVAAIVLGVIIGDYGSWYFAWLVGTGMIVLVAAASAAFFDSQEEDEKNGRGRAHRR